MIFVGIVFVALAAGATVAIVADNANNAASVTLATLPRSFHGASIAEVFLLGAGVAGLFLIGCTFVSVGMRRITRVRRELRDLRDQQDESVQTLIAEKAQLERELARERRRGPEPLSGRPGTPVRLTPGDLSTN